MKRRSSSLTSIGEQEEEGQRCDRRQSLRKKKRVHYKDPDDNNEDDDDDDDDYDDDEEEEEDENYDDTPPYSWDKDVEMWPVICGSKEGMMDVKKLAKSEECIECEGRLFSPPAFEEFGGKGSSKKWKTSIYSGGKPLQYWFDEGLLVTGRFKGAKTFKKRIKNYQNNGYKSSYTTRQNGSVGGSNHSGESEAEITEDSEEEDISERHSGTENWDLSMEEEEGRLSVRNDGDYVNSDHSEEKQDDKLDQDEIEDDWEEFDNPENIFAPKEADPRLIISTPEKLALQMRVNVMIEKMPSKL
ncbi:PREDICTED: MATH and LRR domain-containing protein PFE0570w-like [Cyprinodon variegatus]|uniref:MATH and LRR domain-containing protein PFE0570w-like n=1 Tax=Cyprinodon variegatus TaxID=28743 RepID=UPI000742650D|nr:PREDICTED: MATH and LRR domain-containing protein PFE0570w-like [Cyprinodon variegatus]